MVYTVKGENRSGPYQSLIDGNVLPRINGGNGTANATATIRVAGRAKVGMGGPGKVKCRSKHECRLLQSALARSPITAARKRAASPPVTTR